MRDAAQADASAHAAASASGTTNAWLRSCGSIPATARRIVGPSVASAVIRLSRKSAASGCRRRAPSSASKIATAVRGPMESGLCCRSVRCRRPRATVERPTVRIVRASVRAALAQAGRGLPQCTQGRGPAGCEHYGAAHRPTSAGRWHRTWSVSVISTARGDLSRHVPRKALRRCTDESPETFSLRNAICGRASQVVPIMARQPVLRCACRILPMDDGLVQSQALETKASCGSRS